MPWRNIPPDVLGAMLNVLGLMIAGIIGTTSRIADDIAKGDRKRIWGKELCVDFTSFFIMILVAAAVSEYFEFSRIAGAALAGVMCRSGTPLLDRVLKTLLDNFKWYKS